MITFYGIELNNGRTLEGEKIGELVEEIIARELSSIILEFCHILIKDMKMAITDVKDETIIPAICTISETDKLERILLKSISPLLSVYTRACQRPVCTG